MLKGLVTKESVEALERRLDALERGRVRWTDPPFALQQQSDGTAIRLTQNFPKLVQVTEVSGTSYSFEEIWYPPNGTPTKLIGGVSGYRNGKSVNGVPLVVGAQVLLLDSTQGLDSYALLQPGESNPYYPGEDCCDECRTIRKIVTGVCLYYDPLDPTTLLGIKQSYQIICFPSGEVLFAGCEIIEDCADVDCNDSGYVYPGCCPAELDERMARIIVSDSECVAITDYSQETTWLVTPELTYAAQWCKYTGGTSVAALPSGYTHTACLCVIDAICNPGTGQLTIQVQIIVVRYEDEFATITDDRACAAYAIANTADVCILGLVTVTLPCIESLVYDSGDIVTTVVASGDGDMTGQQCLDNKFSGTSPCCFTEGVDFDITIRLQT